MSLNKHNYISKIKIVNNTSNKIQNLVTVRNTNPNSKTIEKDKISIKSLLSRKDTNNKNIINKTHKKILSNIEDYNNLVKLNISNKLKKISGNKDSENPSHRRINTETTKITNYNFNNRKKKNRNHFVLINTRNTKNNKELRFITEYFQTENSKELTKHKSIFNNNNSLSIDFHESITERGNNSKIYNNIQNKSIKGYSEIINTEIPNKKRYIKYLKANNLYNLSLDNTYSTLKFKKEENNSSNHIDSFDIFQKNKIFMTNYGNSIDANKKQTIFYKYNTNEQRKALRNKFFNNMQNKYSNILTAKPSGQKISNFNLKKYFINGNLNNLTIDSILKERDRSCLYKLRKKNITNKNRNDYSINSKSKDKQYLTTQNSSKNIKSPVIKKKLNIKKKLWNLKINLDRNSKIKIAQILKQNKNIKSQAIKKPNDIIKKIKKIFAITKKGFWQPGTEKQNQDSYFIFKNINNTQNNFFLGVCDGHGKFGKEISSYISQNLANNLNKKILELKTNFKNIPFSLLSKIITNTFNQLNTTLIQNKNIDSSSSGCTCSSLIINQKSIISINLGDSRCVLGKYLEEKNLWTYINLTRDHKPNDIKERERIIKQGGKIFQEKDEFGNRFGVMRIWQNGEGGIGLALTRSFGDDILNKLGVCCVPEIKEFILEKNDKFIIISSDGLWEYIPSQECVNIVKEFYVKNDIKGAGNYLYKEASKRWIIQQDIVDDITIILVFFD